MTKTLTISIAAYQVGQYIDQCLQSIVHSEAIDEIEVFVVDDGGRDDTLEKAERYRAQFPDSIFLVHKENGGYGSTINYSLAHATGKFFKLLDGDDWFDTQGLTRLVNDLRGETADAVVTNFHKGCEPGKMKLVDYAAENPDAERTGQLQSIVGHWGLVYLTEVLRASGLQLPEHCLYTDKLYSTIPFSRVKTIAVYPYSVYQYRIGRDGQSVSRASRIKHLDEYCRVSEQLCAFYEASGLGRDSYVFYRTVNAYHLSIKTILLLKISGANRRRLMQLEKRCREAAPSVYDGAAKSGAKMGRITRLFRKTGYLAYWLFALVPKKLVDF